MKKAKLIAVALGSKRTASDLMPILKELLEDQRPEDELLFNLAEQYAVILDYLPDPGIVVPPLERLASQEETCVRDKAVESLGIVMENYGTRMADSVCKAVDRLARGESFCSRVSACGLFEKVYKHCNEQQREGLRKLYTTLCSDETPMVRRAAAAKLGGLVKVVEKSYVVSELIPVYRQLVQEDTQDSIRVSCVDTAVTLCSILNHEEMRSHCISVITNAAGDRSWRARLCVAKSFTTIAKSVGQEITTDKLVQPFLNLLKDSESEVRCAALECTEHLAEVLSSEQMQSFIVPQITSLGVDQNEKVRAEVARILGPVAVVLGRDASQKLLLSLMLDLMKDEFHDVRLNMVASVGSIAEVLGTEVVANSLLQHVQAIIMDNQWRIRYTVVKQMPALAEQFGQEVFKAKLESLFLQSLTDSVQQVREATIDNLGKIAQRFGSEWATQHLLPLVENNYTPTSGYSSRLTILHAMTQLCAVMSPEQVVQLVVPTLVKATKDTVPNVRICACIQLAGLFDKHVFGPASIENVIKPALTPLKEDTDPEVQYFASLALGKCK